MLLAIVLAASFCGEKPTTDASASVGKASKGKLLGGVALIDSAAVRILPRRHKPRCLNFATSRLVAALRRAGEAVQAKVPGSPALGVGNLSRAKGGPILEFSHSHQSGRDADLAFYLLAAGSKGKPEAAEDLVHFGPDGVEVDGDRRFDVVRNWRLVEALLTDTGIDVRWLFVSEALKQLLLAEGARAGASKKLLERAKETLHQPSDAPPHDDHLHVRIRCAPGEADCR